MILLTLAVVLFAAIHIAPAFPQIKLALQSRFGKAYGPIYGVTMLAALGILFWAFRNAERPDLYSPPVWGRHANFALTFIGFLFVGIFLFRGSWRNTLRYPMLIGTMFWAVGHLLANGDWASVMFISGLAGAALLHVGVKVSQGARIAGDERNGHNLMSLFAGAAAYALFAQLHGALVGVHIIEIGLRAGSVLPQ